MSRPSLFGVYIAQFPFLDTQEAKIRPVIVISEPHSKHNVVAIVPVSSKEKREEIDVAILEWKSAGLLKPSIARIHRLTTILQSDLLAELGILVNDDIRVLQRSMRNFLKL